ncbi:MAG: GNAT family N-acetyltransferase [Acidobacteria bacterium]|nr:GNAT family N-acetyltransferase [Acidobacteriota bacterium]
MEVEVLIGPSAIGLIKNPEFLKKWKKLYQDCPWGSVFQDIDFVNTWYTIYQSSYIPVVVTGIDSNGQLVGLFTLALSRDSDKLVVAGARYVEYAAWLADPRYGNEFIESAIERLREKLPDRTLTLLFALPNIPVEWTQPGNRWSKHCYVKTISRGLMAIADGSSFKNTLRKKKQNKINRLNRIGRLHFDRIEDPDELKEFIDEIFNYQTLRLRAVYNLPDIEEDALKKSFYLSLMRLPGMLHVTALRLDDKLISAQIHIYNKEQVLLYLVTHSPFFSKYSPGELHILMLGMELANQEISTFDLTPGGDYKERYATDHDQVYVITVFFNRAQCQMYKAKRRLSEAIKPLMKGFNIIPAQARNAYSTILDHWQKWSNLNKTDYLFEIFRRLQRSLSHTEKLLIYNCDLDRTQSSADRGTLKRDDIADLLTYQPLEAWQPPVNKFLKKAMEKLEEGCHIYTQVEEGKLVQYGWLVETPTNNGFLGAGWEIVAPLPSNSVLLTDFYTHKSISQSSLYQMLQDASSLSGITQAYICVPSDNRALMRAVEEAGFSYRYSLFKKNFLGRVTSWSTTPQSLSEGGRMPVTVVTRINEPGD